ncbi:MAG TPA: FkbM family methyltransferase [Flavobacterium sp.]|nr:FkbM family methyltransferase [Flavobacterium sp.]
MIIIINKLFLFFLKIINTIGKGLTYKKQILSIKRVLTINFKENSNFNFIQIGANDGISFDFLYEFVSKRNSSGIVVEPIRAYYNELVNNYSKFSEIIPINKAVHPTEKQVTIYKIDENKYNLYPDWVKGIASLDPDHHKKLQIKSEDIVQETVVAEALMDIINTYYKKSKVDFFQIDTEGFDYEILKMIAFNQIKPSIIKYESVNLSKTEQIEAVTLLKGQGYYIIHEGGDTIGYDFKKISLL